MNNKIYDVLNREGTVVLTTFDPTVADYYVRFGSEQYEVLGR